MNKQSPNHLIHESSPYLQKHAYNPVNWYPWNNDTLKEVVKQDKLMLISIGYSACHWCHVMEKESFKNMSVAALMNQHYISVKVDREERPDVDQVYMQAAQLIIGSGGWPLNIIALPDGRPIYAGTYFPMEKWMEVLEYFSELYHSQKDLLLDQANNIIDGMKGSLSLPDHKDKDALSMDQIDSISKRILSQIDPEYGGMHGAPKFPMPSVFEYLLQDYARSGNENVMTAVNTTLRGMAAGGIFDQIGGGFCRYSTDATWKVPHFEKMLYDNAQLLSLYSNAYSLNETPGYKDVIFSTIGFIKREFTDPEGGFYTALDADSEGEEGLFYTWSYQEIIDLAGDLGPKFCTYYQITKEGNWTKNKNILWRKANNGDSENKTTETFAEVRRMLLAERNKRVRPGLDDKVLTSWNALMLKGLLDAYRVLEDNSILALALRNASFLKSEMITKEGKVYRNYHGGKVSISGFLDDYAFVVDAFIHLYRVTFDEQWLYLALDITKYTITHFYDSQKQVFYYTSDEDKELILRPSEYSDNVIPSSASMVASNLFYLSKYFDDESFSIIYDQLIQNIKPQILNRPVYYSAWAKLALSIHHMQKEVVIVGPQAESFRKDLNRHFLPGVVISGGEKRGTLSVFEYKYIEGKTLIYVCKDKKCLEPTDSVAFAIELLKTDTL
jgi:uncharacterized protein YyaL (SSP411 family)